MSHHKKIKDFSRTPTRTIHKHRNSLLRSPGERTRRVEAAKFMTSLERNHLRFVGDDVRGREEWKIKNGSEKSINFRLSGSSDFHMRSASDEEEEKNTKVHSQ